MYTEYATHVDCWFLALSSSHPICPLSPEIPHLGALGQFQIHSAKHLPEKPKTHDNCDCRAAFLQGSVEYNLQESRPSRSISLLKSPTRAHLNSNGGRESANACGMHCSSGGSKGVLPARQNLFQALRSITQPCEHRLRAGQPGGRTPTS